MTLDRPYIVCDRCGHNWTAAVEEPRDCENCGAAALWAFADPQKADDHSQYVVERNDAADTHAENERAWTRGRTMTVARPQASEWDAWFAWLDGVRLDPSVPFADFDEPDDAVQAPETDS